MRFKLDENLPAQVASTLRESGHDAHSVLEEGLGGSPDERIAEVCRIEQRILITLDLDFSDILRYPPADFPGIIVVRLGRQDLCSVLNILPRILELLETERIEQRLWIVDERRTRIRGGD